jgi:hypothetical protein
MVLLIPEYVMAANPILLIHFDISATVSVAKWKATVSVYSLKVYFLDLDSVAGATTNPGK